MEFNAYLRERDRLAVPLAAFRSLAEGLARPRIPSRPLLKSRR